MEKSLEYYLMLPYKIEVTPIPEDLGGGFSASLPEVGRFAMTGDGDTPEEAINNLKKEKERRFQEYLDKGIAIPEPKSDFDEYSGRFVIRIPKVLHKHLSESAKQNGVSLNQYSSYLLATNFQLEKSHEYFNEITDAMTCMSEAIWDIRYQFPEKAESVELLEKEIPRFDAKKLQIAA